MINLERTSVGKAMVAFLLVLVVSMYYFPIGFSFLPRSLNTKQILGVIGIFIAVLECIRDRAVNTSRHIVVSFLLACVFSMWCFFCCVYNDTSDYAYATYFTSFAVWLGGAYAICKLIKYNHGKIDLPMVTKYLAAACVLQCAFVMMVDNIPWFKNIVDTYIVQDDTARRLHRLYGIGCSLDSGGVRFCTVLILIAHQLSTNKKVTESRKATFLYIAAFLIISVIGNMVARTTTVGMLMGLGYMLITIGWAHRAVLTRRQITFRVVFFILLAVIIGLGIYYYNHDGVMRRNIRFAFEAFFNYVETGEFSTYSSDELLTRMWIWPWTEDGWIFGYGLFEWGNWYAYGIQTDIGYCRFTLYCGLIGLGLFSLYFLYNATVVRNRFKNSTILALLLVILTFAIWIKVSTDIFQLYALLFCIPSDYDLEEEEESDE